jgi:putative Mg2+ transporter-C (MgtC) family protein
MILTQDILLKLVLSIVIGGILGAEREYRSKSAGFRTLTLICVGATLFTIFSRIIGGAGNPDRIASNIVTGIGFVGAGVIFKSDGTSKVNGITTAAMIWLTAALGMTIGAGYWLIAIEATGLVLVVLFVFSLLEDKIDRANQLRKYKVVCPYENEILLQYETLFNSHRLRFKRTRQGKSAENMITGEWLVQGTEENHRHVIHELMRDSRITALEF